MKLSDIGVTTERVIGKRIPIEDLFDRRILIEKAIFGQTKYPDKNSSGQRVQLQVVLATFNENPDEDGDFFVKDADGVAIGERRSCFSGSEIIMDTLRQAENRINEMNANRKNNEPKLSVYPLDTTIRQIGKCFQMI